MRRSSIAVGLRVADISARDRLPSGCAAAFFNRTGPDVEGADVCRPSPLACQDGRRAAAGCSTTHAGAASRSPERHDRQAGRGEMAGSAPHPRPLPGQYLFLMTKKEPRIVPASLDFCRANLNVPSSSGISIPSESLKPTARFPSSSSAYITLIDKPLS